jgi:hypothetical protein
MLDRFAVVDGCDSVAQDGRKGDPAAVNLAQMNHATRLRLHDEAVIALNIVELRLEAEGVNGGWIKALFTQETVEGLGRRFVTVLPVLK